MPVMSCAEREREKEIYLTSGSHVTTIAKRRQGRVIPSKSTLLLYKVALEGEKVGQSMGSALPQLPMQ